MKVKYDSIGSGYDNTRKPDPYLVDRMIHHLEPSEEDLYLDIGCGTGNYTDEFQKRGFQFIGIDPSEKMLEVARKRSASVRWLKGSAEKTGLLNESVDGITASLTIHHWQDLETAFSELYRALKPGRRMILFTSTPKQMEGYWLNHYFPKMLKDSIVQMPSFECVKSAMEMAELRIIKTEKYNVLPDLEDQFLYCGKENPALYFDENIRNGISSFSDLSNEEEVQKGLKKLRRDIDRGEIKEVMRSYENDLGDYLYIIAEKQAFNFN